MEKTEKHRFSMKPNIEDTKKEKPVAKRKSRISHNLPQTNDFTNQQNIMEPGNQGAVHVVQPQFYPMQPNGVPVMMNGLPSNAYISNQLTPQVTYGVVGFNNVSLCPFCQQPYKARVEESFNCCTCFTYFIIILLIPILLILAAYSGCNGTHCNNGCDCDCNCHCCVCGTCACNCCTDYNYYCAYCGQKLSSKNSCVELCPCCKSCCDY